MQSIYYAAVGPELTAYALDVERHTLTRQGSVALPAAVQYAWPHPSKRWLYVASSNGGPGRKGDAHHLNALTIDARGDLAVHGTPQPLPSRPIHACVDATGQYALTAYNIPSGLTVHRLAADGTVGAAVPQPDGLDTGIFAHQVLVTPNNRAAILVTRGNDATDASPEDPGALKVFGFNDGRLSNLGSLAPGGGYGFGPRHLDFHPTLPLVYGSIERQNALHVYALGPDGGLGAAPIHLRDTLARPRDVRGKQLAGAIHVHPQGRAVYVSNRSGSTSIYDPNRSAEGEDSIAVFALDGAGVPTLAQHADPQGIHIRNFGIDPSGRALVASSILPQTAHVGGANRLVPAGLSVFAMRPDGRLEFRRKLDIEVGEGMLFWSGLVSLP